MAPLLSIVVPVHSVQGYLRECLDSLLNQSFTDLEVVAVDDRSPDHCPEILDEYAARDRRVRVLHLDPNVGLGRARNVGLDHARGEYVWFVDSDDWIAPGSLHAIAAKLRQTRPDVLLVDHTRVSWLGKHGRSEGRHLLADLDQPMCFSLADQPDVLTLFTVAWNKVVRRDFLVGTGLRFDVGWYEDLPFTFPILVAADRIAALGRVCYHYRKRRQEAITQTTSERHFEVFDQWTRVFDRLDALGARAAPFRGLVFERMLWHLLVVQSRPDRLPAGTRRAYFSRLSEYYRRYAPTTDGVRTAYGDATAAGDPIVVGDPTVAGDPMAEDERVGLVGEATPPISRLNRLRRNLIAKDRYRLFRGLRLARLTLGRVRRRYRRTRRLARSMARTMINAFRTATGRAWYAFQRRLPIDDRLALYAAYWYRGVSCNPAAIDAAARRLVPQVRSVWVLDADRVEDAPLGTTYVIPGTLAYYRALARSRWLVNNVNFPDFVVKRPGTVHLQTHHGTPVKVMGLDQGKYPVGAQGLDLSQLMRRCDRWDFSLSSNAHSTEAWSRSYPCRYTTLEYGYPRNDRLALASAADVAKARALLGIDDERRVVLYAPTHREYQPGFQPFLALDEFADALGSDTLVLQRAHYFYASTPPVTHSCVWDVSDYPVVEDLLLAADVLVTDYSSVLFDYAVLDRPIAVFAPDWEAYTRTRGVTFDLLAEPPGVVATSQAQLQAAFANGAVDSGAAAKLRAQFRAKFCYLDDGYAAERVVRRVFCDELP